MVVGDGAGAGGSAAARRAQILDAATRVFAEKGSHRATIREIAAVAGVADGTIYNYFANKSALLLGLLDRANETEARPGHFARGADDELVGFLRDYLGRRFAVLAETGFDLFQVLLSELLVDRGLRERYQREVLAPTFPLGEAALAERMARGELRPLDPALTARALAAAGVGSLVLRLLGDPVLRERWEEVPDVLAALFARGLVPEGGSDDPATHEES